MIRKPLIFGPIGFLARSIGDFQRKSPNEAFIPLSYFQEALKLEEPQVIELLETAKEALGFEYHPMWPTIKELYFPLVEPLTRFEVP